MEPALACGCSSLGRGGAELRPTDLSIEIAEDELISIRRQLTSVEQLLQRLFGRIYSKEPVSRAARAEIADLVERHFDGIVTQWRTAIRPAFVGTALERSIAEVTLDLTNSLIRFVLHLRDPEELSTYVHMRRHCQNGRLSQANPAQFDVINIGLKQVVLRHLRATVRGRKERELRDVVVAAVDERRLMASCFYLESLESAAHFSEEKYRSFFDYGPDPAYEIDPGTFVMTRTNAAAERFREMCGLDAPPLVGFS